MLKFSILALYFPSEVCTTITNKQRREEFGRKLAVIPGVVKCYFQPPESVKLKYPCIVYQRDNAQTEYADDAPYTFRWRYSVMVIDPNPDSAIPDFLKDHFMYCDFERAFPANNLNHYVFNIYY